ncbi:glucosyl-3-phosphoglycerate phosphatase [bacterium BMS3Bbin10]|nr:glucosyl-3-phosphoglycerate phosphatase [bacterium BMS3Bbin10]
MPIIYVIRHGQTDWNATLRLQGQIDTPLNETGRGQAKRNGQVLADLVANSQDFDFVASPLGRTRETMEIIRSNMGLPAAGYRTDDVLMEIHFGDWQGSTWDELRAEHPDEVAARFDDPWNTVAPGPGGESFAMVSARALGWLESVEQDTVVVTHGGVIRCVMGHIEQMPERKIPLVEIRQDRIHVVGENRIQRL